MTDRKKNTLFVVCAYAFFWAVILLIGIVVITGLLPGEGAPMNLMIALGSWTPTITLLVLFKKIFPGSSIKTFYRNAFKERLNWKMLAVTAIVQILIFISAVSIVALTKKVSLVNLLDLSLHTIGMGFVWTLIQGATGEESGWRGFLLPSIEKKSGVIKSSIIVGIIWGFWHAPLWFFSSGYTGIRLVQYIIGFLISVISLAIIMGICNNRCRNLFVPMLIHFMFNFCLSAFTGDALDIFVWLTVFYVIAAVGYIAWHRRNNIINARTV